MCRAGECSLLHSRSITYKTLQIQQCPSSRTWCKTQNILRLIFFLLFICHCLWFVFICLWFLWDSLLLASPCKLNHSSKIFSCDCSQIIFLGLFLFSCLLFTLLMCLTNRICLEFLSNDSQNHKRKNSSPLPLIFFFLFPSIS